MGRTGRRSNRRCLVRPLESAQVAGGGRAEGRSIVVSGEQSASSVTAPVCLIAVAVVSSERVSAVTLVVIGAAIAVLGLAKSLGGFAWGRIDGDW